MILKYSFKYNSRFLQENGYSLLIFSCLFYLQFQSKFVFILRNVFENIYRYIYFRIFFFMLKYFILLFEWYLRFFYFCFYF